MNSLFYYGDIVRYNGPEPDEPELVGVIGPLTGICLSDEYDACMAVGDKVLPVRLDQITLVKRPLRNHWKHLRKTGRLEFPTRL